jgi:hypothetical protein
MTKVEPLAALMTLDDQLAELRREAALRDHVYSKWVRNGTMKVGVAKRRMAALQAAIATLERLQADAANEGLNTT